MGHRGSICFWGISVGLGGDGWPAALGDSTACVADGGVTLCRSRAEGTAGRKNLGSPFHTIVLVFQLSGNSGKGTKGQRSSKGRLAAGMGIFFPVLLWERNSRGAALGTASSLKVPVMPTG